ncbi:MAG: oxidoreductase [Marmoricola sp.]|nr:oxidoreductase [Marmoricola sp.]
MIKVAVIGLGWWGRKIVEDLAESDVVEVVFGVDPNEVACGALAHLVDTSLGFDEVLAVDNLDAVILCTPHKLHAQQIVAAAEAGKHVFCEKPLTTTGAEAELAISAVTGAGLQLGIGHERRFEPAVLELRRSIRSGELGKPLVFEGNFSQDKFLDLPQDNWRLSAIEAPVGPLSATGIHLVDLAISIFDAPTEVWARLSTQATQFGNGDTLAITLGFEHGETALITAILATPFVGRVTLLGSEGWMEIRDRSHPEDPHGWDVTKQLRGSDATHDFFPPHPTVRDNIEEFARAVQGETTYSVSLEEILANAKTFEAITRSALSGKVESIR